MHRFIKCVVFVVVAFLFMSSVSFAQDPTPPPHSANMQWFCLGADKEKVNNDTRRNHLAKLYIKDGSGYQSEKETYVVVRIAYKNEVALNAKPGEGGTELTGDNSGLTTGNENWDTTVLGGTTGLEKLKSELGFANAGVIDSQYNLVNKLTTTFPVIWRDDLLFTQDGDPKVEDSDRAHYWYGVQEGSATGGAGVGSLGSQQQGTFSFANAADVRDCAVLRWDPFGYVFDAQTHGAVAGVYIRILSSKTENGIYTPVPVGVGQGMVAQNPIATQKDGSYRFYVDPGFYKLELLGDASKSTTQYIIETDIKNIKPGYGEFGYEQVYKAENPEVITEMAGKVERRDIAIKTIGAPAPFVKDGPQLKDILINRSMKSGEQQVRITGMVSLIPVDFIAIYKDVNGNKISEEKFSLVHGHKYVPEGLRDERNFDMWINAKSKDSVGVFKELKISSKYSSKTISLSISPMPSFLDGIAEAKGGKPIVGGTVSIYPMGSGKPSYTTSTDNIGHFVVNSEWIPPFPYELRYRTIMGDETKVTTTEYLKQNAMYHKENNIDSYSIQTIQPSISPFKNETKENSKSGTKTINNYSKSREPQSTISQSNSPVDSGMQGVVIVVIVLMVLVGVAVGAIITMKPKQT